MNILLEIAQHGGLILDAAGLLGLGLLTLAAVRLARRHHSWGSTLLGWGAALLSARPRLRPDRAAGAHP